MFCVSRYTSGTKFCNTEDENEIIHYSEQATLHTHLSIAQIIAKVVYFSTPFIPFSPFFYFMSTLFTWFFPKVIRLCLGVLHLYRDQTFKKFTLNPNLMTKLPSDGLYWNTKIQHKKWVLRTKKYQEMLEGKAGNMSSSQNDTSKQVPESA